jgi:uncharacterized protein (DUF2235 family)
MGKNILIFSDGTGQAGGFMPDEARSNVYKLFRATRVSPETCIDPKRQIAFYDGGLGSRAQGEGIKLRAWRRLYNLLAQATGLGITQNIIDCYAEIIRVWQPGDRIYLFGFSRGAYTVRCVGGVLKYCGVPTAVADHGRVRPLRRDLKSARRIAAEAVKQVYQYGSSTRGDPYRGAREARALRFRVKYCSGDAHTSNTAPYFIGVWDTVSTLGAGSAALAVLAGAYEAAAAAAAGGLAQLSGWPARALFAALGLGVPLMLYLLACLRYKGLVSLARYRMAFYDTKLHYAVRYARHALAIDENRTSFACVPWHDDPPRDGERDSPQRRERFKQMWFAGSHTDVGGSYPETESRLSDVTLSWMVEEALGLPQPILIDRSVLRLYPDSAGVQHDERKAFLSACPAWLARAGVALVGARTFGWREGYRHIPADASLHPSVLERFGRPAVLVHGDMLPYRPRALRRHRQVAGLYVPRPVARRRLRAWAGTAARPSEEAGSARPRVTGRAREATHFPSHHSSWGEG